VGLAYTAGTGLDIRCTGFLSLTSPGWGKFRSQGFRGSRASDLTGTAAGGATDGWGNGGDAPSMTYPPRRPARPLAEGKDSLPSAGKRLPDVPVTAPETGDKTDAELRVLPGRGGLALLVSTLFPRISASAL